MVPLVFKTSVGLERVPGGFDSHSPPPFFTRKPNGQLSITTPRRLAACPPLAVVDLRLSLHAACSADGRVLGRRLWRFLPSNHCDRNAEEQILVPPPMQPMMPPAMPGFSTTDPFGQPTGPQSPMGGFGQPPTAWHRLRL